jgi:hypothetical protein
MESIVISQKRLAVETFYAFSASRYIRDNQVEVGVGSDVFIWWIHTSDQRPDEEAKIVFRISREEIAFRASINDMIQYLIKKWSEFESIAKTKL